MKRRHKHLIQLVIQFIKLQLAGSIIFWNIHRLLLARLFIPSPYVVGLSDSKPNCALYILFSQSRVDIR